MFSFYKYVMSIFERNGKKSLYYEQNIEAVNYNGEALNTTKKRCERLK